MSTPKTTPKKKPRTVTQVHNKVDQVGATIRLIPTGCEYTPELAEERRRELHQYIDEWFNAEMRKVS